MENESEHALTQLSISEHGSDSEAEISNNDIVPRFLTQHSILGSIRILNQRILHQIHLLLLLLTTTSGNRLWNIGLILDMRILLLRGYLPLQSITQDSVLEHYVLTRAIDNWFGPKYGTYNGKSSRLQSFVIHDWPLMLDLPPNALSKAGFFFTGRFSKYFN